MRYPLALGGLALGAVIAVTGCRAGRNPSPYDLSLSHHRTGRPAPAPPYYRPATSAPRPAQVAPPGYHGLPPSRRDAWRHQPPLLRGLPPLRRDAWRPEAPIHKCTTVHLGHGRGTSEQCVQRQDQVITRSDSRVVRDDDSWPDDGRWNDDD